MFVYKEEDIFNFLLSHNALKVPWEKDDNQKERGKSHSTVPCKVGGNAANKTKEEKCEGDRKLKMNCLLLQWRD